MSSQKFHGRLEWIEAVSPSLNIFLLAFIISGRIVYVKHSRIS
jgi:hypothetical protein